ncbi:IS21 family transposase, partial [Methylobacterium sp. E-045]|nr:IS21 family transposase [Methylobacterium sp. E-045]
ELPFFHSTYKRGIYVTKMTALETLFVVRETSSNRRFLHKYSHDHVDPIAFTPASGWEKAQVENQVALVRERVITPRVRLNSYEELNALLLDGVIAYAKAHPHPEERERTVWERFEAERTA